VFHLRSQYCAAATVVVAAFLFSPAARAQAAPSPPAVARPGTEPQGIRQTLTIHSALRRYRVGETRVAEEAAPISYRVVAGHAIVGLELTPVSYSAVSTSLQGSTPFAARLDYRLGTRDTLRIYGRTASSPRSLNTNETAALGAAGTPTLDVDSFSLGTPALVGGRFAHDIPARSATTTFQGAVELEPRPGGTNPVYWRGTTVKGGAAVATATGETRFTAALDVSRSAADSLSGRNLFPGGGSVSVSASGTGPLREDSLTYWQLFGFYFRPVATARPDQPNRLIPVGDFMSVYSSISVPVGLVFLWPSVEISREASHTGTRAGGTEERIAGSGWTTKTGVELTLPVGRGVDLTPGAGYVFGSVGASFTTTTPQLFGPPIVATDAFSDRIRGWWLSLEFTSRF